MVARGAAEVWGAGMSPEDLRREIEAATKELDLGMTQIQEALQMMLTLAKAINAQRQASHIARVINVMGDARPASALRDATRIPNEYEIF